MSAERDEIRRKLGPIAPGPAERKTWVVTRRQPLEFETQPNDLDYDPDAWVALEGVVAGWIKRV